MSTSPRLRQLTVAVRVVPPQPILASYQVLASQHKNLKELLEVRSEGGFGSGFVIVHQASPSEEPRVFVVTNQHVVGLAEVATIEFDGEERKWPGQVVFVDRDYDLAVLALDWRGAGESNPPADFGFGFADKDAHDQDEVVAAGYPGIAGEPSYQVTRGHVSNERLMLEINGSKQVHVQHTASIDPGSSGGPLLNEQGQVLGINTMKIHGREAVGLAVPAGAIQQALERALLTLEANEAAQARPIDACEQLLTDLKSGSLQAVERSLSSKLTARQGPLSLGLLPDDGTDWAELFFVSPEDVFLRALSLRVKRTLVTEDERSAAPACQVKEGIAYVVGNGESRPLTFVKEQGRLKLEDAKLIEGATTSFLRPPAKKKTKWRPSLR